MTVDSPDSRHGFSNAAAVPRRDRLARLLNDPRPPTIGLRLAVLPFLFVPWLLLYEWVVYLGPLRGSFETYLPGELHWPIWQWTELLYLSPYVLVTIAPFLAPTRAALWRFVSAAVIAIVIGMLFFLLVPALSTPRPFHATNMLGRMMLVDRMLDRNNGSASLPSFHVVWAFLGASVFAQCQRRRVLCAGCWAWATLVAASCVFTGMHSLIDVVAGFVLFLLVQRLVWRLASPRHIMD